MQQKLILCIYMFYLASNLAGFLNIHVEEKGDQIFSQLEFKVIHYRRMHQDA